MQPMQPMEVLRTGVGRDVSIYEGRRGPNKVRLGPKKKKKGSVSTYLQPTRGAKEKNKTDVPTYLPFLRFFEIFKPDFRKYFYGVLGLLMQRNGQKRYKKKSMGKDGRKKVFFSQLFRPKVFDF
jgi:hypothetical protein